MQNEVKQADFSNQSQVFGREGKHYQSWWTVEQKTKQTDLQKFFNDKFKCVCFGSDNNCCLVQISALL